VTAPLFVLGVRRSGTTLLRVMLDRNPELAIPDESYFIPQIADRHRGRVDSERFLDDLSRLPTLRDWDVPLDRVRARLRAGSDPGEAISAVYEVYAERHGKQRWGDKTPMYMAHLRLLERLFRSARYVHLVRDGRDAALSFLSMPPGIMTESFGHPRDAEGFACQWRTEVLAARALGSRVGERYLEVRYETLVSAPEAELRRICSFAELPYDGAMLGYAGEVDVSRKPHQQRLLQAPTAGVRDWRTDMSPAELAAFEAIAGPTLVALGYELGGPARRARSTPVASYRAKVTAGRMISLAVRRSPLWRRRHPRLA
jgi:hypothetical protein